MGILSHVLIGILQNELVEVKSEYEHQLRLSRQEVEQLREDTNVLKQQLVKIVKYVV